MKPLHALPILALLALSACSSTPRQQPTAAGIERVFNDPAAGDWQGSWHSIAEGGGHHARVSIVPTPNKPTYTVKLQLSRIEQIIGGFDIPGVAMQQLPDGSFHFEAKVPVAESDAGRVDEAMKIQGKLKGDTLVIEYETNDALKSLDHGQIQLRRVGISDRS